MELTKLMNKKLSFVVNKNENIDELNKELNDYKAIKLKFIQNSDQYSAKQKNSFLENFYNAKLNTMFSIVNYYIENESLSDKTNPFCLLENKDEISKYSAKICHILSKLNIDKVSETKEMSDTYEKLTDIIENSTKIKKTFLRDINFWNEFIQFHDEYNKFELNI